MMKKWPFLNLLAGSPFSHQHSLSRSSISFLFVFSLLVWGCAPKPTFVKKPFKAPELLAVLPMNNFTNDLSGPDVVRTVLYERLIKKGYRLISLDITDEKLKEAGITDGGQLAHLTPREVGRLLGVEGLVYGDLLDFRLVNLGFYVSRQIEVELRFFEVESEEKVWQDDKKYATRKFTVNPEEAVQSFSKESGRKVMQNIFKSPLLEETRVVVGMLMKTLPNK